jgi:hypothetical protein
MGKALEKLEIEEIFLNIIKAMYNKPRANIIPKGEQLKLFLLKSETRQSCPLSLLLFNVVLEFLARAVRQKQQIKGIQIRKEEVKLSLFAVDLILYLRDPKNSTKKLFEIINTFSIVENKINIQKSVCFLYTKNKQTEKEIRETISFTIASKTIKYPGMNLTKETKDLRNENYKPPKIKSKKILEDGKTFHALGLAESTL